MSRWTRTGSDGLDLAVAEAHVNGGGVVFLLPEFHTGLLRATRGHARTVGLWCGDWRAFLRSELVLVDRPPGIQTAAIEILLVHQEGLRFQGLLSTVSRNHSRFLRWATILVRRARPDEAAQWLLEEGA